MSLYYLNYVLKLLTMNTITTPKNKYSLPEFHITLDSKIRNSERIVIKSSADIATVCREIFDADSINWVESFVMICLNKANKVLGFFKVSQGGLTGTVADPKVIYQVALLSNACHIIIAHNHPSGGLKPSRADELLTTKIKEAGKLLDIDLLDHLIMTDEGYYSFLDEGLI